MSFLLSGLVDSRPWSVRFHVEQEGEEKSSHFLLVRPLLSFELIFHRDPTESPKSVVYIQKQVSSALGLREDQIQVHPSPFLSAKQCSDLVSVWPKQIIILEGALGMDSKEDPDLLFQDVMHQLQQETIASFSLNSFQWHLEPFQGLFPQSSLPRLQAYYAIVIVVKGPGIRSQEASLIYFLETRFRNLSALISSKSGSIQGPFFKVKPKRKLTKDVKLLDLKNEDKRLEILEKKLLLDAIKGGQEIVVLFEELQRIDPALLNEWHVTLEQLRNVIQRLQAELSSATVPEMEFIGMKPETQEPEKMRLLQKISDQLYQLIQLRIQLLNTKLIRAQLKKQIQRLSLAAGEVSEEPIHTNQLEQDLKQLEQTVTKIESLKTSAETKEMILLELRSLSLVHLSERSIDVEPPTLNASEIRGAETIGRLEGASAANEIKVEVLLETAPSAPTPSQDDLERAKTAIILSAEQAVAALREETATLHVVEGSDADVKADLENVQTKVEDLKGLESLTVDQLKAKNAEVQKLIENVEEAILLIEAENITEEAVNEAPPVVLAEDIPEAPPLEDTNAPPAPPPPPTPTPTPAPKPPSKPEPKPVSAASTNEALLASIREGKKLKPVKVSPQQPTTTTTTTTAQESSLEKTLEKALGSFRKFVEDEATDEETNNEWDEP